MFRKSLLALLLVLIVGIAQAQDDECPVIVDEVLASLDELCAPLERNAACYGASLVESETVLDPRPEGFFEAPGDHAQLIELSEIRPQTLDVEAGTIGAAVMNVQADVPGTLPGQAVIFLLMGDARLTNESDADSPFQSFYFLPGVSDPGCYEAEPILTIQTPGNIAINIVLNGVDTEMAPGTLLTITPNVCTIHRGSIIQRVGDRTDVLVANQTVDIFIDDAGAVNVTNLRGISEREYERGILVQAALNELVVANDWPELFIRPPIEFAEEPTPEPASDPTPEPAETTEAAEQTTCDVTHVVRTGETLNDIARTYGVTLESLIQANQLANPNVIFIGQTLCIPSGG